MHRQQPTTAADAGARATPPVKNKMFTTMEILDSKVFYVNRPIRFKLRRHNELAKWIYGLVHYVDYTRMKVIYSSSKDVPEYEYISIDDIKSEKASIELLGEDRQG